MIVCTTASWDLWLRARGFLDICTFLSQLKAFHGTCTRSEVLEQFRSSVVCHYTDMHVMASIMKKGSRNAKLHPMVVDASLALRKYGIKVEAVSRSREDGLIQWTDKGSRDFQSDNILLDFVTIMQGI